MQSKRLEGLLIVAVSAGLAILPIALTPKHTRVTNESNKNIIPQKHRFAKSQQNPFEILEISDGY